MPRPASPATTPAARGTRSARPMRVRRHGGQRGHVTVGADVLGQRPGHHVVDQPWRKPRGLNDRAHRRVSRPHGGAPPCHGSDHGTTSVTNRCRTMPSGSRRTSRCPAHRTSSRSGKSSRQCEPRVSSRARAARRQRGGDGEQVGRLPALGGAGGRSAGGQRGELGRRPRPARSVAQHADVCDMICCRRERAASSATAGPPSGSAGSRGRCRLAETGDELGRDPAAEHQPLQQRVGRQPVRAVHAGAGRLAARVTARQRRSPDAGRCEPRPLRSGRPAPPGSARAPDRCRGSSSVA